MGGALAAAAALAFAAAPVWATGSLAAAEAQVRHRQELAVCNSGQSNQSRADCLREAGAAYAQAVRGGLNDGADTYARNARIRCEALSGDDRGACLARMQGQGSTSGSVAAGGIYRELVTVTPGTPAATATPGTAPVTATPK